jgi:predicted membrane protein
VGATTDSGAPARMSVARALTFFVALTVSLVLLLDPYVLGAHLSWRIHAGLPLLMLGVSISFAYALGFKPDGRALRAGFSSARRLVVAGRRGGDPGRRLSGGTAPGAATRCK